jgi:hypothetical protein
VSWRRAQPRIFAAFRLVERWLDQPRSFAWWRKHDPLTAQRILMLILVTQVLLVVLLIR